MRLVLAVHILALLACAHVAKVEQRAEPAPPAWVLDPPLGRDGIVYAVGRSGPTLFAADGLRYAADDARGKLALALHQRVEAIAEDDGKTGFELQKQATDLILQNAVIAASWVDETGRVGEPGSTYALATFDRSGRAFAPGSSAAAGKAGPAWLDRLPSVRGKLYAVGYSGPTFEPDAARQNAADAAVEALAQTMRAHVQAYTLLVEDRTGLSVDEFSRSDDPDQAFLELVKKTARIESVWVDAEGVRPGGEKGSAWALAVIDVQSTQGGMESVPNEDLAPALDPHGNVPR